MISAFLTEESIFDLLVGAQSAGGDFSSQIDSNLKIKNFEPGDFMFDGILDFNDGLYVYLKNTVFELGNGGVDNQTHDPKIHLDLYTSSGASKAGTDAVIFSPQKAHTNMKTVAKQIYDVVMNTQFRRLLSDQVATKTGYREFEISQVRITQASKMFTLRLTESAKSITMFRMIVEPQVMEINNQAVGTALNEVQDSVVAFSDTDDLPDPFPPV